METVSLKTFTKSIKIKKNKEKKKEKKKKTKVFSYYT